MDNALPGMTLPLGVKREYVFCVGTGGQTWERGKHRLAISVEGTVGVGRIHQPASLVAAK